MEKSLPLKKRLTLRDNFSADVIVIVGEVTRIWHQVAPIIEKTIKSRTFTHAASRIFPTDPTSDPRLRGTIALVLQKHFGAPVTA